jgi:hypothetical protein
VITRIAGQQKELRSFALTDMARWGYTGLRSQTTAVSSAAVAGIPAVARGVRIRAETLAGMQLAVWRGIPPMHEPVTTGWRAKLVANAMPNEQQTYFSFWETVGESLGYRSNAYIWMNADPSSGQVLEWYALHPDQVMPVGTDEFRVRVRPGFIDPSGTARPSTASTRARSCTSAGTAPAARASLRARSSSSPTPSASRSPARSTSRRCGRTAPTSRSP